MTLKLQYSIAICPPPEIIAEVDTLKKLLAERIEWFNSRNSKAHITFNVFLADQIELSVWKNYLSHFCKTLSEIELRFVKTGTYQRGALCLFPDEDSRKVLINLMKKIHNGAPLRAESKIIAPHMSIARGLSDIQLATAQELWHNESFNIKFVCRDLAIRRFNPEIKQYVIEERFDFLNQPEWVLF